MADELRRGYRIEIIQNNSGGIKLETQSTSSHTQSNESEEKEVLLIDGEVVPYVSTTEGFRIFYQPPEGTLLEAARSFVDTQPENSK